MAGTVNQTFRNPIAMKGPRGRTPWSTMLLREYAAANWAGLQLFEQWRLGPTSVKLANIQLTPALEAAIRVDNWFADGVIFAPTSTILIEAKIKPTPAAIGQVLFYARLLPSTPGMAGRLQYPITPMVLFAEQDDQVDLFARGLGCQVAIYTPQWIATYLTTVQLRNREKVQPGPSGEASEGGKQSEAPKVPVNSSQGTP